MFEKRLQEIAERKSALLTELEGASEARTTEIEAETALLLAEEASLRTKSDLAGKMGAPLPKLEGRHEGTETEQRARDLRQNRAVTVGSGQLIKPTGTQNTINGMIGGVSSVVDLVKVTSCMGMSAYEVPYQSADMAAAKTTEGTALTEGSPTFAYATIKPVTIATYSEISREAMKLNDIDYYGAVHASALKALRKKVAEFIINSDATTSPSFVGILAATAITASTDLSISAIDATTLRKITMNYGGDEDIIGGAVLLLNKKDLVSFGDVRGTSEKKAIYEITPDAMNPNTGVIKDGGLSVRYCINSNFEGLGAAAVGKYVMAYGVPTCYEVGMFSDYTIRVSEDAAFKSRMLAVLGEVMIGGNVTVKDGFVRVKKSA